MKVSKLPLYLLYTLVFIVALTPAAYAVDGCSSASFKVAPTINLEAGLFGLASADFNGDGHLDLVAIPNGSGEVLLLSGRGGTEKFGPPITFSGGGNAQQAAVGDFNGDTKPDLVITVEGAGQSGQLAILLNNGSGQFLTPIMVNVPGDPSLPILADLNNDGKVDIVAALFTGTTGGSVAILLGNGAGGFTPTAGSPLFTSSVNQHEVVVGDFNGDGKADLAMPGQSFGVIDIRFGDGAGGFGAPLSSNTGATSSILTSGDFNKDGKLDLLNGNRMMLGTGAGSFVAPIVIGIPDNINAAFTADVNLDTHLDVVAGSPGGLTIMLGNAAGNLTRGKSYTSGSTGFTSSFAVVGDFNEDGKQDLAATQRSGIGIMDGDGTGEFHDALNYVTTLTSPRAMVVADFNNDGKQDFAALGQPFGSFPVGAGVEVALGNGAGGFTQKSFSNFGPFAIATIAAADFNGDGKADLAVTRPSEGRVYLLLNDGAGGFPANGNTVPNFFVGFQASAIKAGDFNNDNKSDLVVITPQTNQFSIMLGDGNGGFNINAGHQLHGTSSVFDDVDVGDFNGDNKLDVAIVRSGSTLINVLRGDGFGNFSPYATANTPGTPVSVIVKDLNGDSKPDVAVSSSGPQGFSREAFVTVLINNGAGGFNTAADYPTGDAGGTLGAGDFNNDNHPDLVVSSGFIQVGSNLDGVAVLTNKGNGQFNGWISFSAGAQSGGLAVGDFNSDNEDDVVFTQPFGPAVAVLLNNFTAALPCLNIGDASVTENDSGSVNAVFTVTLSAASAQTVKVNYLTVPAFLTVNSTATKGVDFENVSGTVTFLPGETSKTINIPVKGDLIDEFEQFFFVALTTPINAVISDGKGLGTIVDNDAPATISINDVAVPEGTSIPLSTATFNVTLNGPSEKTITVEFGFTPGTATPNVDYPNFTGTLEFQPGQVSKPIQITITPENIFEPDETFFVNLSNPTNATIADGQGQATITNDDPLPAVSVAAQSTRTEGAQGASGNASVEIRLSNPSFQTITVAFATANGTATAGTDYVATSGTVTFNPGDTLKTISVQVNGDNVDEINETILINLSNPTNATIGAAQGSVLILDDDGPTLSIGNASVTEGNFGATNAVFTVTLSAPSVQDILVNYSTASGTATTGIDVQSIFSNTLVIPPGAASGTITIRVFGDFQIENDETFLVNLQFPTNATIAPGQGSGTGTILNDDSNGKMRFSSATYSATEDQDGFVVTVNRLEGATGIVTVDFATSNGTATAGSDYPATTGTLTFNQGETSKSFFIAIVGDSVFEGAETFNLTLSNPTGGAVLGTPVTAVLTIESPPLLLLLEDAALDPNQAAAVESLWYTRDPFPVISTIDLFGQGLDRNTRVLVFVSNLQLAPNDTASTVRINLVDSSGQTHDLGAEDVRVVPLFEFTQIKFRLPDNLPAGACTIKIKAHDQESNTGTIRIRNP